MMKEEVDMDIEEDMDIINFIIILKKNVILVPNGVHSFNFKL